MTEQERLLREQLGLSDDIKSDPETAALYQRMKKFSQEHPVSILVATPRKADFIDACAWIPNNASTEGRVLELKVSKTRKLGITTHGLVFNSVWKTPHPGDTV